MAVSNIAAQVGQDPALVSKRLRVLREAGTVVVQADAAHDARRQLYAVPAPFLPKPQVIDYGFCALRFG